MFDFNEYVNNVISVVAEHREELMQVQIDLLNTNQKLLGVKWCSEEEYRSLMNTKLPTTDMMVVNLVVHNVLNPAARELFKQIADGEADIQELCKPVF